MSGGREKRQVARERTKAWEPEAPHRPRACRRHTVGTGAVRHGPVMDKTAAGTKASCGGSDQEREKLVGTHERMHMQRAAHLLQCWRCLTTLCSSSGAQLEAVAWLEARPFSPGCSVASCCRGCPRCRHRSVSWPRAAQSWTARCTYPKHHSAAGRPRKCTAPTVGREGRRVRAHHRRAGPKAAQACALGLCTRRQTIVAAFGGLATTGRPPSTLACPAAHLAGALPPHPLPPTWTGARMRHSVQLLISMAARCSRRRFSCSKVQRQGQSRGRVTALPPVKTAPMLCPAAWQQRRGPDPAEPARHSHIHSFAR